MFTEQWSVSECSLSKYRAVRTLTSLQRKEETIQKSIANLREGVEVMKARVLQADLSAFTSVQCIYMYIYLSAFTLVRNELLGSTCDHMCMHM